MTTSSRDATPPTSVLRAAGVGAEPTARPLLLGVDVGGTKIAAGLGDSTGRLLARETLPTRPVGGGLAGLDALCSVVERLLASPVARGRQVAALGVGVAGVTRHAEGVVAWAPALEWRDLPLARQLHRRFGLPTFVENDTNLAALGEYRHGAGRGMDLLVGLFVGTGIGAGIVAEGRLLRGASEAAGEVGYLLPDRAALAREYPGFGALEELVAGPGIARRAAALQARDPGRPSALRAIPAPTARDVTVAAGAGDELAREVILETLDYLALGLAAVACVLDPRRVVLGGSVGLGLAPWYGDLAARLAGRVPRVPELVPSALGPDAALVGALALAERGVRNAERGTGRTRTGDPLAGDERGTRNKDGDVE